MINLVLTRGYQATTAEVVSARLIFRTVAEIARRSVYRGLTRRIRAGEVSSRTAAVSELMNLAGRAHLGDQVAGQELKTPPLPREKICV